MLASRTTPDVEKCFDLVCFSHLRWHFVTQRPQHLLSRAARQRRVFYWEEPVWHNGAPELSRCGDNNAKTFLEVSKQEGSLWILRPHLQEGMDSDAGQKELLKEFMLSFGVEHYVCWYYTPMAINFSDSLEPELVIYDCMDELSAFLNAPAQLADRERQLLARTDIVFTGGISIYENKRRHHPNVHAFPSSIDVAHFAKVENVDDNSLQPSDQVNIPHPRVGFYGVIDERFDTNLLASVSCLCPQVHFVILGPVVKIDVATLPHASNIHYLEGKSYNELPRYLAGWDVAMLPFALNDATKFISPTKTPEYLAAGKPVVSTPIRDVVRSYGDSGLIAIAQTPGEFAAAILRALKPAPATWRVAVEEKLAESSWDSTWVAMEKEMQRAQSARLRTALPVPQVTPRHVPESTYLQRIPAVPQVVKNGLRRLRTEHFDTVVVGAGFAGSVLAERLSSQGERVLVIDKRDHIGGNAFDHYDEHGILVHKYGPHIFHTSSEKVLRYLSRFTDWRPYEHRVLSSIDGQLLPVPINLDTINRLYGLALDADGMKDFLAKRTIIPAIIRTSEEIVLSRVGRELYEKFFRNYTKKQWGVDPAELDASVAGRIPVRFDRDARYFTDTYQVMPRSGYTRMFERMLDQPGITIKTGVDFKDLTRTYPDARIVYTGPIDEYFGFRFGHLPYRSLSFRHETYNREVFQSAPVVNYPNEHSYTRITEFKYLTGQKHPKTSIVYEYPQTGGDPYYPIPRPENAALYSRYEQLARQNDRVDFCGRLASYRYLNMDQVVAQALKTFSRIIRSRRIPLEAFETGSFAALREPPI